MSRLQKVERTFVARPKRYDSLVVKGPSGVCCSVIATFGHLQRNTLLAHYGVVPYHYPQKGFHCRRARQSSGCLNTVDGEAFAMN